MKLPSLATYLRIGAMFLPVMGLLVGDYLVDHWSVAKALEQTLKPYAFNTSLLVALLFGLLQLGWTLARTGKLSSYVVQTLVWLLIFTLVPLKFGHFLTLDPADPIGWNLLGLMFGGVAGVYTLDWFLGSRLMSAYTVNFNPELAARVKEPAVIMVTGRIELALVLMFLLKGCFMVFGPRLLSQVAYLAALPFVANVLVAAFMSFAIGYPAWRVRRIKAAQAGSASAVVPAATVLEPQP